MRSWASRRASGCGVVRRPRQRRPSRRPRPRPRSGTRVRRRPQPRVARQPQQVPRPALARLASAPERGHLHVRHLSVADFRSYATADLALEPGVTTLVGLNGQGKTNLVEAIGYLATLSSHRVATDQPLVRFGSEQAVIRGAVVRGGRESLVELEINPG